MPIKIFKTVLFFAMLVYLSGNWQIANAADKNVMPESAHLPSLAGYRSSIVSIASDGGQGNEHSDISAISANGRYVAFTSYASNLVPGDTNAVQDIFVHDRQTGATTRVSVASNGDQANATSTSPAISTDGRFVAFTSYATNLASGTSGMGDIFVNDRFTGVTEFVSVASGDLLGNKGSDHLSISADGRYVAFALFFKITSPIDPTWGDWHNTIFVRDRLTQQTKRVTPLLEWKPGGTNSWTPNISADGHFVTFMSEIIDLVPGDTKSKNDIFEYDMLTGNTTRISVSSKGAEANDHSYTPTISADGRFVAYLSGASNLVAGDTNGIPDIFVHDRVTGETQRVSVAVDGAQPDNESDFPSISGDGRYVAFQSKASNLVPGDTNNWTDVFLSDLQSGDFRLISFTFDGAQANWISDYPSVSQDGSFVAFRSLAKNLVPQDTNGKRDVFVCDGVDSSKLFLPLVIN